MDLWSNNNHNSIIYLYYVNISFRHTLDSDSDTIKQQLTI